MISPTKIPYLRGSRKAAKLPLNRAERTANKKEVGGVIQGKKAYSTEMAWAKGLARANKEFIFQFEVATAYSLPGKGRSVDFLVEGTYADEIDGEIGHKTLSQKNDDEMRDIFVNEALKKYGVQPIRRIDARLFKDEERIDDLIRQHYL